MSMQMAPINYAHWRKKYSLAQKNTRSFLMACKPHLNGDSEII